MNIEQFGVTLASNPEAPISITADSMAGLILGLRLHQQNLAKAAQVLQLENPDGANERLAVVQASLIGLAGSLDNTLAELLRVGREQGLSFQTIGAAPHH